MAPTAEYDEQHGRLLEGLAGAIREKGLAGTQLTDIVRHARASRSTFYKHFPDKDACFVELTRAMTERVSAQVRTAVDPEADWQTQAGQAIDAYLKSLAADPALTLTYASPSLGDAIVREQRDGMEVFAELVRDVMAAEPFRVAGIPVMSPTRAYFLVSGLHQTTVRAVERDEDVRALAPELKQLFVAAVAAGQYS